MSDPVQDLPVEALVARIDVLERELCDLTRRMAALEAVPARHGVASPTLELGSQSDSRPAIAGEPATTRAASEPASLASDRATPHVTQPALGPAGLLALAGRTLLVLAGGFMIRAVTDAGMLPALGGVALGLVYAVTWIGFADREALAGRRTGAVFLGVAGGLIAYPLVWETTTRFHLLHPAWALAALVSVLAVALGVAWRRGLASLAVIQMVLALGTTGGLLFATRELALVALALLAMAAMAEVLACRDLWTGLRWPAALTLDGAIVILVWLGGRPEGLPEGYPPLRFGVALTAALGLPALYLVSLFVRTLRRGFGVVPFEVVQGSTALALGLLGAERLLSARGTAPVVAGLVTLVLGVACYAAAFAFVERRRGRGRNFYFYATAAGLLTLLGTGAVLSTPASALAWLAMALSSAWCARRFERLSLGYHAAVYLGAAMLSAGLIETCRRNLFGAADAGAPLPTALAWLAAAGALGVYLLLLPARERAGAGDAAAAWWQRVPHALCALLALTAAAGIVVAALASWLPALPGLQAAALASVRTAVVAGLALGAALAGRRFALPELTWLVYPLLGVGALKLLVEDLPAGRPATLFVSFVIYGGALLTAPRLLRHAGDEVTG